jgi:hypothetical protein
MRIPRSGCNSLLVPLLAALTLCAGGPVYRSLSVDQSGQLHIVLDSGKEILPRKTRGQVSFAAPMISPDRQTAGWLVMYPDPTIVYYQGAQVAFELVIHRAGRVLHTFTTDQIFWDWQFQDGGKRVAYRTGPTHGDEAMYVLRDVDSGRILARRWVKQGSEPPVWAQALHH